MFFRELAQFGVGWQVLLAGAGVLVMLLSLAAIPWLRRPQCASLVANTLMNGSTLHSRLVIGFRLVAILPVVTLLPLLAVISTATVQNTQLPQVERLAESIAASIPPLIEDRVIGLESLSGHIAAAGRSDEATLSAALLRQHTASPEFASLWIARPTGDVVVASAIRDGKAVSWEGPVAGVSMMDSFKRSVIAEGSYLSAVEKGAAADSSPVMFVSVPVSLDGDPRWGYVQGLLNLRAVVGDLINQSTGDSVSVVVIDQRNRNILASPGLALEPFGDLSGHPLLTTAPAEMAGKTYAFSGLLNSDGANARYVAVGRSLNNGWRVFATAAQAKADLTLLIYMSLGLIWTLLAVILGRGLAPLYGQVIAGPLQKLDESLDIFDLERTISIIPSAPDDAPQEIRQTYSRVRESMRNSRDAYHNMMKAVNEGIELRKKLSDAKDSGVEGNEVAVAGSEVASGKPKQRRGDNKGSGMRPSGKPKLTVAEEPRIPEETWIGRLDSVTELSGLDVFEGFFGEAWTLGVTDGRPMAIVLLRISATDDQTLKIVAQQLQSSVGRTLDLVARIGAWEFGMVLPDTDLSGALSIGDRTCSLLQSKMPQHASTVHIGVGAIVPNAKGNAQSFLDLCHRALAAAKKEGDGQIVFVNDKGKLQAHSGADLIDWDPGETGVSA